MSLYLIESDSYHITNLCLDNIIKDNNFTKNELIKYDLSIVNVSNVIEDLDTYSMFATRKIIYAYNAEFLVKDKELDHNIHQLERYLNNPNENNVLILGAIKLDGTKAINKIIKKKCQLVSTTININDYIKEAFKGYKIDQETQNYLLEVCGNNLDHLGNEINKLQLYREDKIITKKDIDLIVVKKLDNTVFDFINAIVQKNKKDSLKIYQELINYGNEILPLIIMLSNQFRLIYQVKVLSYLCDEEIYEKLKLKNIKQVAAIRYKINKYSKSDLLDYLYKLSIMDEEVKLGLCIDQIIFPLFIANL